MDGRAGIRVGIALLAAALLVAVAVLVGSLAGRHAPPGAGPVRPPSGTATTTAPAAHAPSGVPSAADCLRRPGVVRLSGRRDAAYQVDAPRNDAGYDLRGVVSVAYPGRTLYPLVFGSVRHGRPTGGTADRLCVVGGTVVGQQPRGLTWQQMKHDHDGDGLRVQAGGWYVVDGLRVDNVEDGISPFGDGLVARNLYFTYIRDDCIENDAISGGYVADSLFDGCYMGLSERPSKGFSPTPPPAGETFTLDGVLLRLQPMPRDDAPDGLGNGQLFKWSRWADRLVLRNSILLVERISMNGRKAMRFPRGTVAHNVTLVWTGPGAYPGPLPAGVRVTRDRAVWDAARARWLARHGYPGS
jgi:hypothetical protein